jgi:hypothetical protein
MIENRRLKTAKAREYTRIRKCFLGDRAAPAARGEKHVENPRADLLAFVFLRVHSRFNCIESIS